MGRRKINISYIRDARIRKVTFSKRMNGVMKKAYELSELCGCEASLLLINEDKIYQYSTIKIDQIMDMYNKMLQEGKPIERRTRSDMAAIICGQRGLGSNVSLSGTSVDVAESEDDSGSQDSQSNILRDNENENQQLYGNEVHLYQALQSSGISKFSETQNYRYPEHDASPLVETSSPLFSSHTQMISPQTRMILQSPNQFQNNSNISIRRHHSQLQQNHTNQFCRNNVLMSQIQQNNLNSPVNDQSRFLIESAGKSSPSVVGSTSPSSSSNFHNTSGAYINRGVDFSNRMGSFVRNQSTYQNSGLQMQEHNNFHQSSSNYLNPNINHQNRHHIQNIQHQKKLHQHMQHQQLIQHQNEQREHILHHTLPQQHASLQNDPNQNEHIQSQINLQNSSYMEEFRSPLDYSNEDLNQRTRVQYSQSAPSSILPYKDIAGACSLNTTLPQPNKRFS